MHSRITHSHLAIRTTRAQTSAQTHSFICKYEYKCIRTSYVGSSRVHRGVSIVMGSVHAPLSFVLAVVFLYVYVHVYVYICVCVCTRSQIKFAGARQCYLVICLALCVRLCV